MAAVTSPARHAASLATSAWNREPRRSKVHRAMEWPKPSSARSSVTMSGSVRARMQTPSCTSYQLGSITTTRFTRTRHSDALRCGAGRAGACTMTLLPRGLKVHLALGYTDMRKGIDGLAMLVRPSVRVPRSQSQPDQDRVLGRDWSLPLHQAA